MKKMSVVALLVVGATVLGATVLREPIASAAQNVGTTITGPLDGDGNVRVHDNGIVKTQDTLNPAAQAIQSSASVGIAPGEISDGATIFTVPAGKRLVVELVTAQIGLSSGGRPISARLVTSLGEPGAPIDHYLPMSFQGTAISGADVYAASEAVHVYAGEGTNVAVAFGVGSTTVAATSGFSISGYLVDA